MSRVQHATAHVHERLVGLIRAITFDDGNHWCFYQSLKQKQAKLFEKGEQKWHRAVQLERKKKKFYSSILFQARQSSNKLSKNYSANKSFFFSAEQMKLERYRVYHQSLIKRCKCQSYPESVWFVFSAESKMAIKETMFFLILIMLPVSMEAKGFGKARSNIEITDLII